MCGGTWPPNRGDPVTRNDTAISLDGADDLIVALLTVFVPATHWLHPNQVSHPEEDLQPGTFVLLQRAFI